MHAINVMNAASTSLSLESAWCACHPCTLLQAICHLWGEQQQLLAVSKCAIMARPPEDAMHKVVTCVGHRAEGSLPQHLPQSRADRKGDFRHPWCVTCGRLCCVEGVLCGLLQVVWHCIWCVCLGTCVCICAE